MDESRGEFRPETGTHPRVCVVNAALPPNYGGAELAALRYAERLHERGFPVILMAPASGRTFPDWVEAVNRRNGDVHATSGRSLGRVAGLARDLWPRLFARRRDFDLVHVFNSAPLFNLMAVPAARLLRKPVILEMSLLGSDDPLRLKQRRGRRRLPLIPRPPLRYLLFRGGQQFVSKSSPLTRAYLEAGMPAERLVEIPYAVDLHVFRPPSREEKHELRERLELPATDVVILFVGGMNPRKRVHDLVEAFQRVAAVHADARLVAVGPADQYEPSYVQALHAAAAGSGVSDRIEFVHGLVENVSEYMRAADIFCLPSSREGLPISVLEAMAVGLAIVASDIPEISGSQVDHGDQGLLVPVGDIPVLTESLASLVGDPDLRARLGGAAHHRAESEFSADVVHARYQELYASLLGSDRM